MQLPALFDLTGKVAVVTGGGGVLCGAISGGLASAGAKIAIADCSIEKAQRKADEIDSRGGIAKAYPVDVLDRASTETCCETVLSDFGRIDVLVNGVGGNRKEATTSPEQSFFDLPVEAFREVSF